MSNEKSKSQYCSNCKKDVVASNFTIHTAHCTRHLTPCQVCGEPVPRAQYQNHLQAEHSTLKCSKCGADIEALKIYAHEHDECPRRLVACQHCELALPSEELPKHVEYCGARTERCKGCTKYVQIRHLQFHYNSDHKYLSPDDQAKGDGNDSGDENAEECPICLGPITLPLALECGHVFCMVCVKGIANTTKNCAICRRDIPRDMLMDIRFCREEDVIKNYVNKPRDKKTFRSHSVPGRAPAVSVSRRVTTQDYDDMVSHLMSNRTSSASVRYQRPNNTHTPSSYTPYSYTSINSSTTSSSYTTNDDDCCCSSSSQNKNASSTQSSTTTVATATSHTNTTPSVSQSTVSSTTHTSGLTSTTTASTCRTSLGTLGNTSSTSSTTSESRPKRPTSLALSSSLNESSESFPRGRRGPPPNASQEQYDRWLAFQLAQTEDDISAAEFNKKHRPVIGRSQSMPEREIAAATNRTTVETSDSSDSSEEDDDEDDDDTAVDKVKCYTSSRPPASPRTCSSLSSSQSSQSSASYSSNSSLSASSRSPSLTKSSSDSIANGNNATGNGTSNCSRAINTGTRPKSSGLKKRVSFKEEAPEERREAPVMLPCEFCDEMFPERDLMRHQTSCDLNETQMPRVRRESLTSPPLLNSPSKNQSTPTTPVRGFTSSSYSPDHSSNLSSPSSPPSRRKTPPNLPSAPYSSKREECPRGSHNDTFKTPPNSPLPRPPQPSCLSSRIRSSPLHSSELTDSSTSSDSRPTSVSPCPPHSNNSSSSGISSMASSIRSVSSTPSSSSSASPIPAVVDTPTDIEADFEDDDTPFVKPRRGKLLSSAIGSWRTMSGSRSDKFKYARSNTAPLDHSGEESPEPNPVVNSHSTSQLPPLPPRPESTPVEPNHSTNSEGNGSSGNYSQTSQMKPRTQPVFIKRHKKYRAPPPPASHSTKSEKENKNTNSHSQNNNKQENPQNGTYFKLDSKPMMNGEIEKTENNYKKCQTCNRHIPEHEFHIHQNTCSASLQEQKDSRSFRGSSVHSGTSNQDSSSSVSDVNVSNDTDDDCNHSFLRRHDRAQSVLDERCFSQPRISRLERAHSIKEGSRGRPYYSSSMGQRWASRDSLLCQRGESPSAFSSNSSFSGVASSGSSSSQEGKLAGRGWSDHVSMVHEDVKTKLNTAKALVYEREKESETKEGNGKKPSFLPDIRSWIERTEPNVNSPTFGSSRYRSSSMARPSLYASGTFGSTTRLSSLDYRSPYESTSPRPSFNLGDSFSSAFRRRYMRSKKRRAPGPPAGVGQGRL